MALQALNLAHIVEGYDTATYIPNGRIYLEALERGRRTSSARCPGEAALRGTHAADSCPGPGPVEWTVHMLAPRLNRRAYNPVIGCKRRGEEKTRQAVDTPRSNATVGSAYRGNEWPYTRFSNQATR